MVHGVPIIFSIMIHVSRCFKILKLAVRWILTEEAPGPAEMTEQHEVPRTERSALLGHWGENPWTGSLRIDIKLVGGLEHVFNFPIYWECHHPN